MVSHMEITLKSGYENSITKSSITSWIMMLASKRALYF